MTVDHHIAKVVDAAPKWTPERRAQVAAILRGAPAPPDRKAKAA